MDIKGKMFMAGDFNLVMDEELDTQSTRKHSASSRWGAGVDRCVVFNASTD